MKTIFINAIIILSILTGCGRKPKQVKPVEFDSGSIKQLVLKAVNGDSSVNAKLHHLVDLTLPINNQFNQFIIDSLVTNSGIKLYTVLLSYPNPLYNRLAIYNNRLKLYLIDKSLNGYLAGNFMKVDDKNFLKLNEQFFTKDILKLERISLYQISGTSANLVFRAFTKLEEPKITYTQTVEEITGDRIKTTLKSSKFSKLKNKADIFEYDKSLKKYVSKDEIFYKSIKEIIDRFKRKPEKPELIDRNSALMSVGINPDSITARTGDTRNHSGFSIPLTNDWQELKGITITRFLSKKIIGTKYINNLIGSEITVVMIPPQDSAEQYIGSKLIHSSGGKYLVRYSDKIPIQQDFVQYFEYSCQNKKYLMIISASKNTYDKYKSLFQNIINSFSIEC